MLGPSIHKVLFAIAKFAAPKIGETEGRLNYTHNLEKELGENAKELVTDQSKLKGLKYGDSDIGKTGCEAVAIYNILRLKGSPVLLSDIIRKLQEHQTLINRGHWGTNPFDLDYVLEDYGLNYEEVGSIEEADQKMRPGNMLFVTVWNHRINLFKGIHGYLIVMTEEGKYVIFNKNYGPHPEGAETLNEAIGEGRYIVGYLIR